MNFQQRLLTLFFAQLAISSIGNATSECYGRTTDGKSVLVRVETTGAMGAPNQGEVIIEDEHNHYGYQFTKDDITQYYEYDDSSDGSAVVGLLAYTKSESPVSLKYLGPNFKDSDLKTIVKEGTVATLKGNFLRLWKGPGFESRNQYQISQIACGTWTDL